MVSFRNVRSCGTATALSVPCMFSNMTRRGYDEARAQSQDGLLDVLQHAGISVLWKETTAAARGVQKRPHHRD